MVQDQLYLSEVVSMIQVFRLEKKKWPLHAAELQSFSLGLGRSLDFSKFCRFRFIAKSARELVLDFWLSPLKDEMSLRGEAEVTVEELENQDTLPLHVEIKNLAPQKMEARSYCFVGEPAVSRKSA